VAIFVVLAGLGVYAATHRPQDPASPPIPVSRSCNVQTESGSVTLSYEQMANAATVAAVGLSRKVPDRAVVVALAAAMQESRLRNLDHGDRDSLGLFQQRPSQGWGNPDQIRDPRYASNRFYTALLKVRNWEAMRVTEAAQRVQRSAYPEAYENWADDAQILSEALTGQAEGAVACTGLKATDATLVGADAADRLDESLRLDWGAIVATREPGLAGLIVEAADARSGWQLAHWLVAHSADSGIRRVSFAAREWSAAEGHWRSVPDAEQGRVVAEVYAGP
jgi:hypothetical protein